MLKAKIIKLSVSLLKVIKRYNLLSDRQKAFIREYLIDLNGSAAVVRAGYKSANPHIYANQLMLKPEVSAAIQQEMDARAERTKLTADKVVAELRDIAFDDIRNYLEFKNVEYNVIDAITEQPVTINKVDVRMKDSSGISTKNIKKVKISKDGEFEFELYSRDSALDKLMKHTGGYEKDNAQKAKSEIDVAKLSTDEKIAYLKLIQKAST